MTINGLSEWAADLLLNEKVHCTDEHFLIAVHHCNLEVLKVLVSHCRNWKPIVCVRNLQSSNHSDGSNHSKLDMIKWICQWLAVHNLPCTMAADPTNLSLYRVHVGVVSNDGQLERSCKAVDICG